MPSFSQAQFTFQFYIYCNMLGSRDDDLVVCIVSYFSWSSLGKFHYTKSCWCQTWPTVSNIFQKLNKVQGSQLELNWKWREIQMQKMLETCRASLARAVGWLMQCGSSGQARQFKLSMAQDNASYTHIRKKAHISPGYILEATER